MCLKWNYTAIDCYDKGCRCSECSIYHYYFKGKHYKCHMKNVVLELVRELGIPTPEIRKYYQEKD